MIKHLLFSALFILGSMLHPAWSQQFELIKDINPNSRNFAPDISKNVSLRNLLIYTNSVNVYSMDGTNEGIRLTNLTYSENNTVRDLTAGSRYVFFKAYYEGNHWLFRTDGTILGTLPLHQIWSSRSDEGDILDINGTVYFSGALARGALELWKTDGTVAGTTLVKAFSVEPDSSPQIVGSYNFNGKLVFQIKSGFNSNATFQTWTSDGTAAGTVAGGIIYPDIVYVTLGSYLYYIEDNALKRTDGITSVTVRQGFTSIYGLVTVGPQIFFRADDGISGPEIWKSDGTTAGTLLVKDLFQGTSNFYVGPLYWISYKGGLYFFASSDAGTELWKTDGTPAGTVLVSGISENPASYIIYPVGTINNNQLAFVVDFAGYQRLWKSDGTTSGTTQATDLDISSVPFFALNNVYFTVAADGGYPLFVSDLTADGTKQISRPVKTGSDPSQLTNADGRVYFIADQGTAGGQELWKTDGTTAGTTLIKDLLPTSTYGSIQLAATVNKTLYIITNQNMLWRSDGTTAGTIMIKDASSNYGVINSFKILKNVLYFVIDNETKRSIWKTDGTVAGTSQVKLFAGEQSYHLNLTVFKDALYFVAYDGINSFELWKSDGTTAGTVVVTDDPQPNDWKPVYGNMVANGNFLYYMFFKENGFKLMKSDGTAAGTSLVRDFLDGNYADSEFSDFYTAGGLTYFSSLGFDKEYLWRSDGTSAGTFQLASFDGNIFLSDPYIRHWTDLGGKLSFVPYDKEEGDQLWVTDGTIAGTRQLTFIDRPPTLRYEDQSEYSIRYSTMAGSIQYFALSDPATGRELWRSDGTQAGTFMVLDYHPEPRTGTSFTGMTDLNGTLILGADGELYKIKTSVPAVSAIRINSGGAIFNATAGRLFSSDDFFSGMTSISNAVSGDILNTTDDQLYKEQRFGTSFNYDIPVKNGKVDIILHFAEIYWGVPSRSGTTGTNKRKFNVDIEGVRKLTNYDIFTVAGGAMRARTERFTVNITDGVLDISFLSGTADKPIIAAIEVIPDGQFLLEPVADTYVRNTPNQEINYGKETTLEVKAGSLPSYQRDSYLRFALNGISQLSSAKLRIYGSNVQNTTSASLSVFGVEDDNWLETGIAWYNAPVGTGGSLSSVNVNNTAKYYELDVTAYVRSQLSGNRAVSLLLTNPTAQNAQLSFNSRENAANRPQLVIETAAPPAARMGEEQEIVLLETRPEASSIYPNPATKSFFVQVSKAHKGNVDLQLTNLSGNPVWEPKFESVRPATKVEVDLTSQKLPSGIYLLKIRSAAFSETMKVLLTGQ
ncbi:DNRLRE domain-containing protein [Dyadobacter sp. NIV53]|uniref:CBM96 family carbohydrate-binding protein n=1 Tax=Dyadobacter sp. NIV53 TaxID=2861765 RepID=UPI001C8687AA|nr:DNRLRE domain-containing protein [Dyadobacter sp. NIV53]